MDQMQRTLTETIDTLTQANALRTEVREMIIEHQQVLVENAVTCYERAESYLRKAELHGPNGLSWDDRLGCARLALSNYQGVLDFQYSFDVARGLKPRRPALRVPSQWPDGPAGD